MKPKPTETLLDAFAGWVAGAAGVSVVAGVCFVSGNLILGSLGLMAVVIYLCLMARWVSRLSPSDNDIEQRIRNDHV